MTSDPVVLLVDDNELVRGSVSAVLRREGFDVLAFATGEEAIGAIESGKFDFAFALIDLSLPDIPGERVVVALRMRDPNVRILAISGYPANMLKPQLDMIGVNSFLQKPFDTEELLEALSVSLD